MNRKLMPAFGPPPLGPYEEVARRANQGDCPVCGHDMGEHVIDHSTANAILLCPAQELPGHGGRDDTSHLNELGMPIRGERARRFGR
ncbi:MAG TPA: hypothetical protein VGP10_04220 [Marisediminicola sp.]|nr:hypothetical protein [Marisediminicola sp.]